MGIISEYCEDHRNGVMRSSRPTKGEVNIKNVFYVLALTVCHVMTGHHALHGV